MRAISIATILCVLTGCMTELDLVPIDDQPELGAAFIGEPVTPSPLSGWHVEQPSGLASAGSAGMHADSYNSDVHPWMAPLGQHSQIQSRQVSAYFGGQCATVTFDRGGRLVALCAPISGFEIHLLEPRTLNLLARYPLPSRPSTFQALVQADKQIIMSDTSGGAYFYLDDQDRVVLIDSQQRLLRIRHQQDDQGQWSFQLDDSWQLTHEQVPQDCQNWDNWFTQDDCDPATAVLPDANGLIWWVTRKGRVGTLDPEKGVVQIHRLAGEEIQNGFAADGDGVYIVSDHALYAMYADEQGRPQVRWRESYDRGSSRKVGSINQGSGTSPTLLGDQYIAIADNADERINLLVYRRDVAAQGNRLICQLPLFDAGASATDNSMIGWGRTLIVENNHGYHNAMQQEDWLAVTGGISRVDIREDESGCDLIWASEERSPSTVPKVSLEAGLAYFYTFENDAEVPESSSNVWYLTALDVATGETRFKIRTGAGMNFDNNWAPISLGPDGTAYVGTFKGMVAIWDQLETVAR